ncbi:hypothetical protein BDV12DRAFT_189557 [Aspergillus spectabilis]
MGAEPPRLCDHGKDVIVLAHSYGGVVSSAAENDQARGVVMIIYMTAFVISKGATLVAACGGQLFPWKGSYASDIRAEGAFHDLPETEQGHWTAALTHASLLLPLQIQEHMVGTLGTPRTVRLKSSHHPFPSMPQTVADIVERLSNNV